jgi:hypothetical protein
VAGTAAARRGVAIPATAERLDLLGTLDLRQAQTRPDGIHPVAVRLWYAAEPIVQVTEKVEMARPTGFEPATFGSGGRRSIH